MPIERALSVTWDTQDDTKQIKPTQKEIEFKKSRLLSFISSIYDSIWLIVTLTCLKQSWSSKNFGEEIWNGMSSYQIILDKDGLQWKTTHFIANYQNSTVEYKCGTVTTTNSCCASECAYGAAVYLRSICNELVTCHYYFFGISRLDLLKQKS